MDRPTPELARINPESPCQLGLREPNLPGERVEEPCRTLGDLAALPAQRPKHRSQPSTEPDYQRNALSLVCSDTR